MTESDQEIEIILKERKRITDLLTRLSNSIEKKKFDPYSNYDPVTEQQWALAQAIDLVNGGILHELKDGSTVVADAEGWVIPGVLHI